MSEDPFSSPTPTVPPRAYAPAIQRSSWPTVVGVIALIFAAFDLFGACASAAGPYMMEAMRKSMPPDAAAGIPDYSAHRLALLLLSACTLILAILLILAGILLLKRFRRAARLAFIWAVLKCILLIFNTFYAVVMQKGQLQASLPGQGLPPGLTPQSMQALTLVVIVLGFLWSAALPIFMFVWFSRRKIKDEMAAWSA